MAPTSQTVDLLLIEKTKSLRMRAFVFDESQLQGSRVTHIKK
jgi:hypothetical protein